MSYVLDEIASQPDCWTRAAELAVGDASTALPDPGARVAVVGCGTSLFMAQSFAVLRERAGHGETDAFAASEFPAGRRYDHVVAICRSGTTTEVVQLLADLPAAQQSTVLTTGTDLPAAKSARHTILLDFADERSVVQTRFATTSLALWRAHIGQDLQPVIDDARTAAGTCPTPDVVSREQFTFLGSGWTIGLANEAP